MASRDYFDLIQDIMPATMVVGGDVDRSPSFGLPGAKHLAPIWQAVDAGRIMFAIHIAGKTGHRFLVSHDMPMLSLYGDDRYEALGPKAFPEDLVAAEAEAADFVVVVPGVPAVTPYEEAVAHLTRAGERGVIVETRYEQLEEWCWAFDRAHPSLNLRIWDGGLSTGHRNLAVLWC